MKVVITDYEYEDVDQEKEIIEQAGFEFKTYQLKTPQELIPVLKDADAVITQYGDINHQVISQMEKCKVIVRYGIGYNNIDVNAATENNIYVCNVPDYCIDEVSNHVIMMIFSLSKKLPVFSKASTEEDFSYRKAKPIFRLAGQTLGLVGFGRIPRLVAEKMQNFSLNIIAYDPFVDSSVFEKYGVSQVSLDELLKLSDYISLHTPLTEETYHLINHDAFLKMKSNAYIINTSRGEIISEKDLLEALNKNLIAGAGLDVFEKEPVEPNNPLLSLPNVIVTPHSAWYSEEAKRSLQKKAALEVINVLQGNKPFNPVNK
ncbi:MAG TPA: C-terminal binding protein [Clostridiaceae bacterium]|nr:C-terminal binding protein [Clostridiaceae bacterium]